MKNTISLSVLVLAFSASTSFATNLYCYGYASIPGSYLSGTCHSGQCTGNIYGGSLSVSGNCEGRASFTATAFMPGGFVDGQCNNGQFQANISGSSVNWSGTCSGGGYFSASPNYLPNNFVYGSCSENGSFNAQLPPTQVNVSAQCIVPEPTEADSDTSID